MTFPVLIPEALTIVAVLALLLAAIGIGLAAAALRRVAALQRHYTALMTGVEGTNLAAALENQTVRLTAAEAAIAELDAAAAALDERLRGAVQKVAVSRYSAFADSGGDQSFSVALLDDREHGVLLSGLYGRAGGRVYAKPVAAGESTYVLTDEESRVLNDARGGKRRSLAGVQ